MWATAPPFGLPNYRKTEVVLLLFMQVDQKSLQTEGKLRATSQFMCQTASPTAASAVAIARSLSPGQVQEEVVQKALLLLINIAHSRRFTSQTMVMLGGNNYTIASSS
jgi:hypothetical protein